MIHDIDWWLAARAAIRRCGTRAPLSDAEIAAFLSFPIGSILTHELVDSLALTLEAEVPEHEGQSSMSGAVPRAGPRWPA